MADHESPDQEAPVDSRREIHQATGMVLAQLDTTPDDAYLIIQARAFSQNRSMRAIATTIVQMAWTTVRQWRFAPKSPATASLQHQRIDEVTPGPDPLSSRRIHHANPQI